ncbi:MAG: hypothetical protein WHV66_11115 [Anaerolineales bacterium]
MQFIPLSFGVPLGLLVALVGAILFFVTKRKKVAAVVFSVGLTITAATVIPIRLALSSMP